MYSMYIRTASNSLFYLAIIVTTFSGIIYAGDKTEETLAVELTTNNFDASIAENNYFVKFFAPWCGHCKRLHSLWEQLAEIMNVKDDPQVIIAKVDCTQHQELCAKHKITGYPTLRFFKVGEKESLKFKGTRDMPAITEFINEQLNSDDEIPHVKNNADTTQVPNKRKLFELNEEIFAKHVSSGTHFVKFYAPWCSHCQRLAPIWEQLAKSLQTEPRVSVVKIDCTAYRPTCQDFEVKGYPTLLWIEDGKKIEKYSGSREFDELQAYVQKMLGIDNNEEASSIENQVSTKQLELQVLDLTGDNFEKFIANGVTFVKFYAPWCGHCQKLSLVWDELASKIHGSSEDIKIAKVDCTSLENKKLCIEQQVEGYPTLFVYKNGERQNEYEGIRSLPELVRYVNKFAGHDEL